MLFYSLWVSGQQISRRSLGVQEVDWKVTPLKEKKGMRQDEREEAPDCDAALSSAQGKWAGSKIWQRELQMQVQTRESLGKAGGEILSKDCPLEASPVA